MLAYERRSERNSEVEASTEESWQVLQGTVLWLLILGKGRQRPGLEKQIESAAGRSNDALRVVVKVIPL